MFRKPMRLEKWIAFDGAGLVDLIETAEPDVAWREEASVHDADGEAVEVCAVSEGAGIDPGLLPFFLLDGTQTSNTLYCAFADYPEYDGLVSLTFPIGMFRPSHIDPAQAIYLPFVGDSAITLNIDPAAGILLEHLYIDISFPEGGMFTVYSGSLGMAFNEFVIQNNIPADTVIAYSPEGIRDAGNFSSTVRIGTVSSHGLTDTVHVARGLIHNGSLRLGFLPEATLEDVNAILNSLVYCSTGGNSSQSFSVSIFYDETGSPYSPNKLGSGSESAFVSENSSGTLEDTSRPCDETGAVIGGDANGGNPNPGNPDPGTEPPPDPVEPEPEPEPPPDPYIPPTESGKGGGDSAEEPSREAQDNAESADPDADPNDAGVWAAYVIEKEYLEEEEGSNIATDNGETESGEPAGQTAETDEENIGAPFPDDDLVREVELALAGVREVHRALAEAMNRLYAEYAHRQEESWPAGARERLAEMLAAGNAQKQQLSRMTELMNREMDAFRNTPADRRDGMLAEATRELADAAARRAGDTGPLVDALTAVANLMQNARMANASPPESPDLANAFDNSHRQAAEKWQILAERRDPMGKDLEFYARLRGTRD